MIQNSIEHLVVIRNRVLQHFFEESVGAALFIWLLFSIVTVVLTGALVQIFAPKAAGAGVTLVMAFLNGVLLTCCTRGYPVLTLCDVRFAEYIFYMQVLT